MITVVQYSPETCAVYKRLVHPVLIQTLNDTVTVQSVKLILAAPCFVLSFRCPASYMYNLRIYSSQMISRNPKQRSDGLILSIFKQCLQLMYHLPTIPWPPRPHLGVV